MSFTPHIVLICALQFADFLRLCLSPRTTSRTISFSIPIVFGINLIPFFDIGSVLAIFVGACALYLGHCVVATVAVCGFGSCAFVFLGGSETERKTMHAYPLVFHCGLPRQISHSPPNPLSNRGLGVLNNGRKHKIVFVLQSNAVRK